MQVWQAVYRPNGGQVFTFPLMAVWAPGYDEARLIAGGAGTSEQAVRDFVELALDCAQAQDRLGIWGDVAAGDRILRGD